eukprot:1359048-Pyramimonas_sp.AAC.1
MQKGRPRCACHFLAPLPSRSGSIRGRSVQRGLGAGTCADEWLTHARLRGNDPPSYIPPSHLAPRISLAQRRAPMGAVRDCDRMLWKEPSSSSTSPSRPPS